ncbi:Protein sidekick like [Dissostichus eleginoides]|uniref:Protein sidekick like n=1 Tax=Dissostichus eleginoides TaxID=100907 RepID=A0AAD9C694_DISEL|nr:Protein sidekick like [Dissostichus eleginoides]
MASFSWIRICFLSLTQAAAGFQSFDNVVMFALLGDSITLPCGIPSIKHCSSVNWNMAGEFHTVTEVVKAGRVTAPERGALLKDCSLKINHLVLDDARLYSCDNGVLNSNVSLEILKVVENPNPVEDTIELQCFLNMYRGLVACNNKGIHIKWITEDNSPLNGDRFQFKYPSKCFSKLIITKKRTDHHRKWKCQLTQNDMVKATITYTTTIKDGIEEVFTAVGESVSLSCRNTSSLSVGGSVKWAVGERTLTDDISPYGGQTEALHLNKDSSLVITKVGALNAGDYQCSESTDEQKVFKIRLHTLDVTSERVPGGDNLTLTCVLTCSKECGKDFDLLWSGGSHNSWQSGLIHVNNTLLNKLFLPVLSVTGELTCSIQREGEVMASKKWRSIDPLQTPAWVAVPLALLMCISAIGLYMYMKRKHNKNTENEQPSIGMTHIYEVIQDKHIEGPHQHRHTERGAVTTTDSFYDLLQAVN